METGAPLPEIEELGDFLRCSYICTNPDFPGWDSGESPDHPGFDEYCAVLEFEGVTSYKFGAPNDEGLYEHPLHNLGVGFYGFYKLTSSPELELLPDHYLWVATFHDETLQVVARSLKILSRRINVSQPKEALKRVQ
mgnify:CR=1 FL=1